MKRLSVYSYDSKGQTVEYKERLERLERIGFLIGGEADMYQPKQLIRLTN